MPHITLAFDTDRADAYDDMCAQLAVFLRDLEAHGAVHGCAEIRIAERVYEDTAVRRQWRWVYNPSPADEDPCDGRHRPDDLPAPGDRCKDCGREITWDGPGPYDWSLAH